MAWKKVRAKDLENLKKASEIKQKKRKQGSDDTPKGDDDACAFCDDGGTVTCCDGGCLRSFHLADQKSEDLQCRLAIGVTKRQAKIIIDKKEIFMCKNCKYKQHQCFVCGLLGSSDLSSSVEDDQVFQCEHEDCGYFYHAKCVAELLYPDSEQVIFFEQQVTARVGFFCPRHECIECKKVENKDDWDMQFAVCRRCPTVYHRKCLPSDIHFHSKDGFQRAWNGIIRNRVLIYCTKHDIIEELKTPERNLIVFPDAKKLRVPKIPEGTPMEQDIPEEEERLDHPSSEQSQPPPSAAKYQDQLDHTLSEPSQAPAAGGQCSCCGPFDSFAPKALFMHPQPGSCGWLDD